MRDEPADLAPAQVTAALSAYWGIEATDIEYAPIGHGSYHWTAPWTDGPYGESARGLLTRTAAGIEALLRHFEQLVDRLDAADEPWVITHGEPHAGDVLVDNSGGMHLIDWDDTRLAPRERDLRILLHGHHQAPLGWDNDDVVAAYQRSTGPFQPRDFVLDLFRAEWALAAIGDSKLFRQPHHDTADTAARWRDLATYLPVEQNWPDLV